MKPPRRVVITGLGALTPIGNTVAEYWEGLATGKSGSALITKFDTQKFKTKFACEVKNLDVEKFIDRKEARRLDPFSQFALIAADQAMVDAGFDMEKVDRDRFGVIMGSGIGGIKTFQEEVGDYAKGDGTPRFNPFFVPKMIVDICAGHVSIKYGLQGPNFVTVSACASSSNAMVDAFNYIRWNQADIILTGGAESSITECGMGGFNAMKAMSERNDSPESASRPYDKNRDGFVMGEGSCILIFEELEHAKARGAKIYAEVLGGGMSADAHHMTAPHPEGHGALMVMKNALADANLKIEDVDYINTHGTSTPLGDVSEVKAVQKLFGEHAYKLNISSTKSMTGHLLGAAGSIEALAGIFAIQKQIIPPTINHFEDDEAFDPKLNFTFNKPQHRKVEIVLSNTFGFGGHNCAIILGKYNG
jgi:3-oxoacyl-[acyl-carrier-protein] synthase II